MLKIMMGWSLSIVFLSWFIASFLAPTIGYQAVGIIFLISVASSGIVVSRRWVFFNAVLLSLIHNFFFIPPLYHFEIKSTQDSMMYLLYFLAAFFIGQLTSRLKKQKEIIEEREKRTLALFNLAHAISEASQMDEVLKVGKESLEKIFSAEVKVLLPKEGEIRKGREGAVCELARQSGKITGRFTLESSDAIATYFPLLIRKQVLGVVSLKLPRRESLTTDHIDFAQALVGQIASGLDREKSHEAKRKLEVLEQADRLFHALFDSVSHELKTPLTTIKGAASVLSSEQTLSHEIVSDLGAQIETQTERLLGVVGNMLDMTRLESGNLKPRISTYDIADILGPCLAQLHKQDSIQTDVASDIRPLKCDAPLVVQALSNILHNSLIYTEGTAIEVRAANCEKDQVEIEVRDHGPGLPPNPELVLQPFYRQNPEKSGGLGLGLSIARGFIEAQGGKLLAKNAPSGGAVFTITLPAG